MKERRRGQHKPNRRYYKPKTQQRQQRKCKQKEQKQKETSGLLSATTRNQANQCKSPRHTELLHTSRQNRKQQTTQGQKVGGEYPVGSANLLCRRGEFQNTVPHGCKRYGSRDALRIQNRSHAENTANLKRQHSGSQRSKTDPENHSKPVPPCSRGHEIIPESERISRRIYGQTNRNGKTSSSGIRLVGTHAVDNKKPHSNGKERSRKNHEGPHLYPN